MRLISRILAAAALASCWPIVVFAEQPTPHPGSVMAKPSFEFIQLPSLLQIAQTSTQTRTSTKAAATTGVFSRPKPPKKSAGAPQDHTPLFRRTHGRAAQSAGATCNFCHLGVSGSKRDPCRDCHAITRPKSHTLRWRSTGHGRVAAQRPKDCAVCHEVDWCTECHNVAPQSHFPLQTFRTRHERIARINARSCMTCHTFESTCERCRSIDTTRVPQ
jgi:hypothetical protein